MVKGLAAYKTDPYFDPNRPAWLPYWIDDPLESQNKAAYALATGALGPGGILAAPYVAGQIPTSGAGVYSMPPAPPTIQPPDMATDPTGQTVNIDAQIAAQQAAYQLALQQWAAQQAGQTPVDNSSVGAMLNQVAAVFGGNPAAGSTINWLWIALGLGGFFLLMTFYKGGR